MATIRFKRGDRDPVIGVQPSGLTLGEPVFNTQLNKFWIGGSGAAGFTGIWIGAEIENSVNWNSPSEYKLATQAAISSRISAIVGASAGVQTIEGLSGAIDLVFGTGISGSTSAGTITLQNTGVTRLGFSGDWRTRGVTNFNGPGTGGVTLGSEVWAGNANPSLNSYPTFGITAGTVLTGKTPMEILEMMLVQYLNPSFDTISMGFALPSGIVATSNVGIPLGISLDSNNISNITWTLNPSGLGNVIGGATLSTHSDTTTVIGIVGTRVIDSFGVTGITNTTYLSYNGFSAAYKGITTNASTLRSRVRFTLTGRNTNNGTFAISNSATNWWPRLYWGWTGNPSLNYPIDSWKSIGVLNTSITSGKLIESTSATTPNVILSESDTGDPPGGGSQYLYLWVPNQYNPEIKDVNNAAFAMTPDSPFVVSGVTIDDGVNTIVYKRYRSQELLAGAQVVRIGPT